MYFAFSVCPSAAITSESFCAILWGYSKSRLRCEAKRAEGLISFHSWVLLLTTQSAFCVSLFSVSSELYGWTTTSLISSWFGNTEYVCTSFFGYLEIEEYILFSVKTFNRSVIVHARNKTLSNKSRVCVCGPVIEFLQQIGSESWARSASNGVTQDKSLQRQKGYSLLAVQICSYSMCHVCIKLKLYWRRKLNVCGWANASLPWQLYKWECSPTSQIGSLTPPRQPCNTCLPHSPGYYHQTFYTPHPANIHTLTAARPTFLSNAHMSAHTQ